MRRLSVLLLLLNCLASAAAVDRFVFNVTFTCEYHQREKYDYNVQFLETDWVFSGNSITPQKIGEARPGLSHFVMEGEQDGDQVFSKNYSVQMVLFHDCTEYENEVKLIMNIVPWCKHEKGMCRYTIFKDIKDLSGEVEYRAKLEYS